MARRAAIPVYQKIFSTVDHLVRINLEAGVAASIAAKRDYDTSRMDQMTQQNAALVEQAAAATQSMRDQATQLAMLVSVFRLEAAAVTLPATASLPGLIRLNAVT